MMKKIKQLFMLMLLTFMICASAMAQKVANYSLGKYGTSSYEHLSFWIEDGKASKVTYSFGSNGEELKASYLGATMYMGSKAFKIMLPGRYTMFVIPSGAKLRVIGPSKKYNKTFSWEYEGPVNGVGTYCSVCTQDEKEAMQLIKTAYLKQ